MKQIDLNIGGQDLVFCVEFEHDSDAGAPWENSDSHGIVSNWERRAKGPGELILCEDRGSKRFYDFQRSCAIALRDGWDAAPYDGDETKRQQAEKATRADYEYLRKWCNAEWEYVGVIVTLLDEEGKKTEVSDSLWAVETSGDHHEIVAREIADNLAHEFGTQYDKVTKYSFAYFPIKPMVQPCAL